MAADRAVIEHPPGAETQWDLRFGPKSHPDAGFSEMRVRVNVFCDPLCGEAHSFSDPFSELATDEPLDRAADQWDADPAQPQHLGVDAGQDLLHRGARGAVVLTIAVLRCRQGPGVEFAVGVSGNASITTTAAGIM